MRIPAFIKNVWAPAANTLSLLTATFLVYSFSYTARVGALTFLLCYKIIS